MKKIISTLILASLAICLFAQTKQNPWLDTPESSFAKKSSERRIVPTKYRTLSLDLDLLKANLSEAPMRFSPEAENSPVKLAIPMPDGTMQEFQMVDAPIMHPDLAARYPYIRSFAGWSNADRTAYLRCGYTQKGFHGMILSANHSTVYIDAFAEGDDLHYISYFKNDYPNPHTDFECLTEDTSPNPQSAIANPQSIAVGDCQHRNYALALACTGEYATFHGGTKPLVMAEFNVAMTRINGIYEKDLAVTMTMVANTDLLIYLNAGSDPYTNNSGSTMLNENQTTCNAVIGNANYDIGHVFSTGGGGIAQLNAVCNNSGKARGVTGLGSPVGDGFYVDYVCHEMGHQFGGNHTQNNDCNRNSATAMEVGSGTTIMGYAGVCAPNVQPHSDDYFHAVSLGEITSHLLGAGNSCATTTASGNNPPDVSVTQGSYTIPVSTPFVLTAQATDGNPTDVLTYCWEQMNNQVGTQPPLATNTVGPVFRTFNPTTSEKRYFPNLAAILAGTTPTWEVLPSVARSMAFRCTVRDNHPISGCTDEANVTVNVSAAAGPFVVTNPNTSAITWTGGSTATVTWNVANTTAPPVAASQVEILLSADGGNTYPYTLMASTNNDGTETVLVPNIATTQARVMVKALGNIFFDISNQNFKIELAVVPSFTLITTPTSAAACQSGAANFGFEMLQLAGFNTPVSFTATGVPAGATAIFTPNNMPPPATTNLSVGNLTGVAPGVYPITVTATGGSVTQTSNLTLTVLDQVTTGTTLSTPTDGAEVTDFQPTLNWTAVANAAEYLVEVSESPDFNSIFATGTVTTNSWQVSTPCSPLGVYYWRVLAQNPCSQSDFSQISAFHLGTIGCQTFTATGLPLTIPVVATSVTKTLNVPANLSINSVQANMNIAHTYVGDLDVELTSPQGTTLQIFDRPGVPASSFGCDGDNITASFSDSFANSALVFENTCLGTTPTISGNYKPIDPFDGFIGENSMGNWTLKITDSYDDDGGALTNWSLDICGLVPSPLAVLVKNEILNVPQGLSANVSQTYLQGQGSPNSQVVFTLLSLPVNGYLTIGVDVPSIGTTFTQADIDAGLLSYQHDGSMTTSDEFEFDMVDNAGSWLHAQVFHINILQNTLAATAAITQAISCAGANNAQITVTATGGNAPLQYSLNGGAFQSGNVFSNLAAGSYTVEVKDNIGFTLATASLTISNPAQVMASAAVNNAQITVTASGGTGGLQYSLNGGAFQGSNVFTGLANGTYTVTVMDANGCTATTSATVAVNTVVASASIVHGISCFGANNGEISVTASGGNSPYTYSLNGGAFQNNSIFANLAPGSYTVTVKDADGFTQTTSTLTITNPAQLTAASTVNANSITVNASGGTGSLQYSLNGGAFQGSNVFNNLPNGTYTITVKDANGCTATEMATVFTNNIVVSVTASASVSCFGESDGEIVAQATGGVAPYTFSLNGGAFQINNVFSNLAPGSYTVTSKDADGVLQNSQVIVIAAPPQLTGTSSTSGYTVTVTASGGTGSLQYSIDGGSFQSSNSFSPIASGTHSILVMDANGCQIAFSTTVTVPALTISGNISQQISCAGQADGQITANGGGGVPTYTYSLNGGAFQSGSVFSNLAAGAYTLTIKDSGGFTVSSSNITLTAPPALVVNASAAGQTVTVSANGGSAPYHFQLDGGSSQTSNIFTNVANGPHTITVVDDHGCTQTATVFVGAMPPNVFVSLSQPISCHGESDGVITVNASGGMPPYTYSLNGGAFQSSNVFPNLAAGSYSVTVKGADGGTTTAPNIIINDPPVLGVSATTFGLTITASGTGGSPSYQFSLDGVNFNTGNALNVSDNGSYTVTIQDEHGCTATTTVVVNAVVGITNNITDVSCFGEEDGEITIPGVTGGIAPYEYSLDGGAFSSQTSYAGLPPGDHTITVKDATGYEAVLAFSISEPSELEVNFQLVQNNLTILAGGGTGILMYSIDGGLNFQSSNIFSNLPLGTYQVVVMDENGCTIGGQVIVDMSATGEQLGSLIFEVLPNPSEGLFILKMDLPSFAKLELSVFDVVGRQVFASQMEAVGALQQSLDLQGLASGTYFLKVNDGELSGVKRLVIIRD